MAAQAKIRLIPGSKAGLNHVPIVSAPQKTSAAFAKGDPVKLSSGNLVAVSTVNSGAASAVTFVKTSSLNNILGIAEGSAAASSTSNIPVARIMEGVTFIGNLVHPTASSAKVSKIGSTAYLAHIAASDTKWGWTTYTTSVSSTGSLVRGTITRLIDAASTVNGRVEVEITNGGALVN